MWREHTLYSLHARTWAIHSSCWAAVTRERIEKEKNEMKITHRKKIMVKVIVNREFRKKRSRTSEWSEHTSENEKCSDSATDTVDASVSFSSENRMLARKRISYGRIIQCEIHFPQLNGMNVNAEWSRVCVHRIKLELSQNIQLEAKHLFQIIYEFRFERK